MLIVEDGTQVVNANGYVSVEDAIAYHSLQGNAEWTFRPDLHEVAIINATSALDMQYGGQYRGAILSDSQPLLFPRSTFTDSQGRKHQSGSIPKALKDAVCELALEVVNGNEAVNTITQDSLVTSESVSVGSGAVSESKTYAMAINEKSLQRTKSDSLITALTIGGSGSITALRG